MNARASAAPTSRWGWLAVAVVFWAVLGWLIWDLLNPVAAIGVGLAGLVSVLVVLVRAVRGSSTGPTPPKNPRTPPE